MSNNHFGNEIAQVILYHTIHPYGLIMVPFTWSTLNHCAFRISGDTAESVDWGSWKKSRSYLRHDLNNPRWYYLGYLILDPIDMTPQQRKIALECHENFTREYDWKRIPRMGARKIMRTPQDGTNISSDGTNVTICPEHIQRCYMESGWKSGLEDIEPTQLEPPQFLKGNFRIYERYLRGFGKFNQRFFFFLSQRNL